MNLDFEGAAPKSLYSIGTATAGSVLLQGNLDLVESAYFGTSRVVVVECLR